MLIISKQKFVDCVNIDCVICIYDINGVVNCVLIKDMVYLGFVCVMNFQSREFGKWKVEVCVVKCIVIMIGVFICFWILFLLIVLLMRDSEFIILQVYVLIVIVILGMCLVVINLLLYSVFNR